MGDKTPTILNIGSGRRPLDGEYTVNLDLPPDDAEEHFRGVQKKPTVFGDAHHLPFRRFSFSLVTSFHCLEHLKRPFDSLLEVNRVLMDGGYVVIEVPDAKKVPNERREHLYSWTKWSLRNLYREAGFTKVRKMPEKLYKFGDIHYINQRVILVRSKT